MTDFDLEKLGEQWRQQPTSEELEGLKRSAETVRRRAFWGQVVDVGAALILAGVVLILVLANPQIDTALIGGAAILMLLVSQARQRRLRSVELRSLSGRTEEMLDQSIARAEATLKRVRFSLIGSPPAFLLGLLFASTAEIGSGSTQFADVNRVAALVAVAVLAFLTATFVHLLRLKRRSKRELERLTLLRDIYRRENAANIEE